MRREQKRQDALSIYTCGSPDVANMHPGRIGLAGGTHGGEELNVSVNTALDEERLGGEVVNGVNNEIDFAVTVDQARGGVLSEHFVEIKDLAIGANLGEEALGGGGVGRARKRKGG